MSDFVGSGEHGHRVLLPFVVGALVGVAVGLLVAPHSGQETRRQISDLAHRARERANDLATRARRAARAASDTGTGA